MPITSRLVSTLLSGVAVLSLSLPAPAQNDASKMRTGLRNVRYCEILIATHKMAKIQTTVYNTLGLSDCPAANWAKIDTATIKQESSALAVDKNGPRYWMIDAMTYSGGNTQRTFSGIPMRAVANAQIPLKALLGGAVQPYHETSVARDTSWIYDGGKPIFALVSPDGVTYAMQSYSQIVNPHLSMADLPTLGSHLHLPPGWLYVVFTPASTLSLSSNGMAHVIQDDLKDTYQRI